MRMVPRTQVQHVQVVVINLLSNHCDISGEFTSYMLFKSMFIWCFFVFEYKNVHNVISMLMPMGCSISTPFKEGVGLDKDLFSH